MRLNSNTISNIYIYVCVCVCVCVILLVWIYNALEVSYEIHPNNKNDTS